MLIGYVSDERYVALPDVAAGVRQRPRRVVGGPVAGARVRAPGPAAGRVHASSSRSRASGRSSAASRCPPPSRTSSACSPTGCSATPGRSGCGPARQSEFRVHSVEPYKLELWRYGWEPEFVRGLGWHDEHGPRATMQVTPDGDYTRTGVEWNKVGYAQLGPLAARRRPRAQRAVLLPRLDRESGRQFALPLGRRARRSRTRADGGAGVEHHLERLQQLRRAEQLHPRRRPAADADGQLARTN